MALKKSHKSSINKTGFTRQIMYCVKQNKRIYTLLTLIALFLFLAILSSFSIALLTISSVISVLVIFHTLLKLSATLKPRSNILFNSDKNYKPFVSIHVACKSESATIVNETIKALTMLDYKNYEVIVIHSNDQNKENWIKIKKYVESCGDNYIFVHLDKVSGFKAGALNYLNENHISKDADLVAIVDCDYIVTPDFLTETVGYFNDPKVGIVQAPQDYYNVNQYNIGLMYEYRSFFTLVMNQAQRFNLVNFTGTMGLIRASLLINDGLKWSEWCITEDTEAGTYINSIGYRGVYVDKSLGKGLMPFDYSSLAKQRQRWVYGNMQIIGKDMYSVVTHNAFSTKQKISFIAQLVTWSHLELLIVSFYLATSIFVFLGARDNYMITNNNLLATALVVTVVGNLLYFIIGLRDEASLTNRFKAFLAHYGLIYVMSSGWLIYLIGYKLGFNVTNKEKTGKKVKLKHLPRELTISILLVIIAYIKLHSNMWTTIDLYAIIGFLIVEMSGVIYLNRSFIKSVEDK